MNTYRTRSRSNKKKIRSFMLDLLEPFEDYYQEFYASLKKNEVNEEYLNMRVQDDRERRGL